MTALSGLFKKAAAVESSTVTPAPTSGFKIGGQKPSVPAESAGVTTPQASVPPPAKSIGGFKIGGGGSPSPTKEESIPVAETPPAGATVESAPPKVRFDDERPATAPQRELPDDVSAEVKRFVANLDNLQALAPEPELASSAIRGIMIELKHNPAYMKHVSPDDVRVMIQVMRETMGLTKATKEKAAAKRTASKNKVTSAEVQSVMDEFADLDGL